LVAPNWFDDDGPLRYQFHYKHPNSEENEFVAISASQNSSKLTTILTSLGQNIDIQLKVSVIDYYMANSTTTTSVYLTSNFSGNLSETLEFIKETLAYVENISDP